MGVFGEIGRGALAAAAMLCLAGAAFAQDGIRMIEGALTYRERSGLPPDTLAVVEAYDARGRLMGEAVLGTRGNQVPLDFAIGIPAGLDATLKAGLFAGARALWFADDIGVAAGEGDLDLGDVVLRRFLPTGIASTLRCGGETLRVGFFDRTVIIDSDGKRIVLDQAEEGRFQASGEAGTWLLSRGNRVTISLDGAVLPECTVVPPDSPEPYLARGNEPGWTVRIDEGRMSLTTDYGATTVDAGMPEAWFADGEFVYAVPDLDLTVRLSPVPCRDDMTGMPYPETAEVEFRGGTLTGCGGDPGELLQGAWSVAAIDGLEALPGTTLIFDGDRLTGQAPCNRFATSLTIAGEGVAVGPVAATRVMCAPEAMEAERAFFAALAATGRFDMDEDGALLLFDHARSEPAILARR